MPPRFTQVPPQQPPQLQGRFTPVSRPTGSIGSASQPDPFRAGLGIAKGANSLFGLGSAIAGSPRFTAVSQGLGGAFGVAQGSMNLARGNTIPGALQTASGVAQLGGATGAGALLGLGSGAYDLAQGGSGQDIAFGMAALANPAFSTIYAGSQLAGMAMDALARNRGPTAQTPLPIAERGRGFSAAENAPSQISKMRGIQGAQGLQRFIKQSPDANNLFSLAQMGSNPNWSSLPTGEIQFTHKNTPTPAAYGQLMQAVQSGDVNALRNFISGVSIQTGEGGATTANYPLTDWYRRQFVSSLPVNHPLRQNMTGLFEPTPQSYLEPLQYMASINPGYFALGGGLDRGFSPEDLTSNWGSMYAPPALSTFGRTGQENASLTALHEQSTAIRNNPDFAQYIDRQTYPGYYPVGGMEGGGEAVPWPSQLVAARLAANTPRPGYWSGDNYVPEIVGPPSGTPASLIPGSTATLAQQFADLNAWQATQDELYNINQMVGGG